MEGPAISLSVSIAFGSLPLLGRPAAAAALGYRSIESWWPWDTVATVRQGRGLAEALEASGTRLYLLNVMEGDAHWGGRGLAGIPAAGDAFRRNSDSVLDVVDRTHTPFINVLAGTGPEVSVDILIDRLAEFAERADEVGATVLVEQLNPIDHPGYLLTDPWTTLDVVRQARSTSRRGRIGMLADLYHLSGAGHDPVSFLRENEAEIGHIQVADFPGRGLPGTGSAPIGRAIRSAVAAGYTGAVGLECLPGPAGVPTLRDARTLIDTV